MMFDTRGKYDALKEPYESGACLVEEAATY